MSTHKWIDAVCMAAAVVAVVLTVLLMIGAAVGIVPVINTEAGSGQFTAYDLNDDWDTSSATSIVLSDEGSMIEGNGAYVHEGNVYIAYAGCYVLTGTLTNGSVVIEADKNDQVWVLLDGVTIHCDDGAAIQIEQADHVFLTLADGTESTISSGGQYDTETAASGVDGTVYSRDDLTINGSGSLVVDAQYSHGIVCNDDLMLTGGKLTISAVQDGIHANDSVRVRDSELLISAGDDGITVSNDDETAFLYVESGSITIPNCYEGLEAVDITIAGGSIDVTPTDDGINANGSGENSVIRITDGDIRITNPSGRDADGLDSNGSIYVEGGKVFISVADSGGNCALDYGSENGGECVVSGGTVIACGGSAMAEGFDAGSAQGFLMYNTAAEAGTAVCLTDAGGEKLLSETIPCSFSSVVLSTPELQVGDTCTIMVGDAQEQITIDNTSSEGFGPPEMFRGGGMHGGGNRPMRPAGRGLDEQRNMEMPESPEEMLPAIDMLEPPDQTDMPDGRPFVPDDTLILLGISVLVLLLGTAAAVRTEH